MVKPSYLGTDCIYLSLDSLSSNKFLKLSKKHFGSIMLSEFLASIAHIKDFPVPLSYLEESSGVDWRNWYAAYHGAFGRGYWNLKNCDDYEYRHVHASYLEYSYLLIRAKSIDHFHPKTINLFDSNMRHFLKYWGLELVILEKLSNSRITNITHHLYVDAIGAMEQFHRLHEYMRADWRGIHLEQNILNIPFILVELIENIENTQEFDPLIFDRFIYYFLLMEVTHIYRECDKHCSTKCTRYQRIDTVRLALFGYLIIFCCENIHRMISNLSIDAIAGFIKLNALRLSKRFRNDKHSDFIKRAKLLKRTFRKRGDLKESGVCKVMYAIDYFMKMESMHGSNQCKCGTMEQRDFKISYNNLLFHAIGKIYSLHLNKYKIATGLLVVSVCSAFSLYERCISLRALSENCYASKQYLIGKKVLSTMYVLCKGLILPSFERNYPSKWRKFKQKLKKMKCANTDCCNRAILCCKGCMSEFYCSKRCQKIQWKTGHRGVCSREWVRWHEQDKIDQGWHGAYEMLRETIFCKL